MDMSENKEQRKFLRGIREFAAYIGVCEPVAAKIAHQKGSPAVWISKRVVIFPVESIENWLRQKAGA